ncbi:glycosyltransferase family 2 protein [Azohydromonas lata]|uniref:glycosyltransferase family 2 protein n=1 Tax=Azohydromonas lata TaxID=45677 RepID=UPI0014717966|nr:glycosyltransferase family 2 protein [Azohydromonas lata]
MHDLIPKVSVVIVNWNAKRYLLECLESLAGCAYRGNLEIIVVDNNSSDGSQEAVRKEFPKVNLIRNSDNFGFAKANNIGIKQCTGEYIALINSDVNVDAGCIAYLVDFLEKNPTVGMAGPRIIGGDGKQQLSCRGFPSLWNMACRALALDVVFQNSEWATGYQLPHRPDDRCSEVDILSGCFWLARRSAIDTVGLLDEAFFIYGEDMDWCKRFWSAGWPIVYVPFTASVHYGGASSANAPQRFFVEMQKADLQYWIKHHSAGAVFMYKAIVFAHHGIRVVGHFAKSAIKSSSRQSHRHKVACSLACIKWLLSYNKQQILDPVKA